MPRRILPVVVILALLRWPAPAVAGLAAAPSPERVEREAAALTERLVAPCCWRESLREHHSPLAEELRAEIRGRLAAGEAPPAIEADLIGRYGPKLRAFSPDWDPRRTTGVIVALVVVGGLVWLVRWTRRRRPVAVSAAAPALADPRLEDLLDDELASATD